MSNGLQTTSDRLMVNGYTIAVRRHGTGTPAVVFISGRGDSGQEWEPVLGRLGSSVVGLTHDRPGTGDSDDLSPERATVPRTASWMAGQLVDLLKTVGVIDPAILVGHSLGGQIADALAVRWPHKVCGLVLVDSVDPELQLDIVPPHPLIDDAANGRAGRGWLWDVAASAREFRTTAPTSTPPTVVIASAIWRWFGAKEPERYRPFTLAEVDQRWQRAQLEYATRWHGDLVVAHEAGHRVHEDAPSLVAAAVDAVVAAARAGTAPDLNADLLRRSGGSRRPTSSAR